MITAFPSKVWLLESVIFIFIGFSQYDFEVYDENRGWVRVYINESRLDRVARVGLGILLMFVGFRGLGGVTGTPATVAGVAGIILVVTGMYGFCPVYWLFGFSTKRRDASPDTSKER